MRVLLLVGALAALAGCTGSNGGQDPFGALYGVDLLGDGPCVATIPFPQLDGAAWAPLLPVRVTNGTAEVVDTEHGVALRLAGNGTIRATASNSTDAAPTAELSLRQGAFRAEDEREVATFRARIEGCAGYDLNLGWARDAAGGAVTTVIGHRFDAGASQGWVDVEGARDG